jgi:pSer/pThr/pTyr-binding forkhead associated (FHA) protein
MAPGTLTGRAATRLLVVEGHGGLLAGCRHELAPGQVLVVGRSRSCHLSLRRTRSFARRDDAADLLRSRPFNRVSRVHCEIEHRRDGRVEVRDLSRNGTFVDGARIERVAVVSPDTHRVKVELVDSTWGALLLSLA